MNRTTSTAGRVATAVLAALVLTAAPAAFAGKGGGGNGGGKHSRVASTGSFELKLVDSTDGTAHWGQSITFDVTSNARYVFVDVECSQAGTPVYRQGRGFYDGWPLDQRNFTLKSGAWTGGAADCSAVLYSTEADGSGYTALATTTFAVAA